MFSRRWICSHSRYLDVFLYCVPIKFPVNFKSIICSKRDRDSAALSDSRSKTIIMVFFCGINSVLTGDGRTEL